ncbi:MAG TPA: 50S ribosomal protein L32 [Clostridia bacterium]|nr:50S ribosomal protein L32 [Clostridia bacterium]
MAVPKKKMSKSRRDMRKSQWKLVAPKIVTCPRCHQPKLPHRVCPNCGYYRNREVVKAE